MNNNITNLQEISIGNNYEILFYSVLLATCNSCSLFWFCKKDCRSWKGNIPINTIFIIILKFSLFTANLPET